MDEKDVFAYITAQESAWKTDRVPLTQSKSWNMYEHIERCTNLSNAWYHRGSNEDGLRPYDDIVTPVINVAFRSEGFDVKDIIPFVDDASKSFKSFLVKKYHPKWARKNELDTFIDELVETSIIYDLALIKKVNKVAPEIVDLRTIAFCDQTDVIAGPICIKHQYTPAELTKFKGKWNDEAIDMAIAKAVDNKKVSQANDQQAKTPGKYIEVYELRGNLPDRWINENWEKNKYTDQAHMVCYHTDSNGSKSGIKLYEGIDKPLSEVFKAMKIDQVRSKGRACGRSIVETLIEPQVWNNYSAIKVKKMLDSAISLFHTDSDELDGTKLSDIKENTILKHEAGRTFGRIDTSLENMTHFTNYQVAQSEKARLLGSASEGALGNNPTAGTPFALQNLIVQEGQGMHEYRQGKIATFVADVLYRDWILELLVEDMNEGKKFSDELSLDELGEIADIIAENEVEKEVKKKLFKDRKVMTKEDRETAKELYRLKFIKSGNRKFFEILKGELKDIPMDVMVNIKGKQRYMAQNADKITNVIREVIKNPQAFTQVPGIGKAFNQLLEESGMSPIDFAPMIKAVETQEIKASNIEEISPSVGGETLKDNNQ